jgi:hypothetical protein
MDIGATGVPTWKIAMKRILIAAACCLAASQPLTAKENAASVSVSDSVHGAKVVGSPASDTRVSRAKAPTVSFQRDLIPLFRDNCTMCHQGDVPMAALALTPDEAYANLVGVSSMQSEMLRVTPGRPDRSYLYYKTAGKNALVKGGGIGMPWASALSRAELELLRNWIKQGARNN